VTAVPRQLEGTGPLVRFAPAPTGFIHIGNARTALYNWLFAHAAGGRFLLRFDDTDLQRSRAEYAAAIEEDLAWLGIVPDAVERQSDRIGKYEDAAERLKRAGLLYPCYETAEELDRQRSRQRARGRPPVYDRRGLKLAAGDRARLEAEGRRPHWRFLLPNFSADPFAPERTEVGWDDLVRGRQAVDLASLSDPVIAREDGSFLYTFTSAVDDAEFGVTHVIRGDDHVTNTGVQIALFRALGAAPPVFAHHNLLQSGSGEGLSKRNAALSLRAFRAEGIEALAVAALAVLTGTAEPVVPIASLSELQARFDLSKVNLAPARFSVEELKALSAKVLAHLPYDAVGERLHRLGVGGGAAFWDAVRGNLATLEDAARWWRLVEGPIEPQVDADDQPLLVKAAELLPPEPWDATTWSAWTTTLRNATGRSGKRLFLPLRLALTGLSSGPELARLLPVLGRPNTLDRLRAPASPRSS
jgi:glutamyl-tRNA synthetase